MRNQVLSVLLRAQRGALNEVTTSVRGVSSSVAACAAAAQGDVAGVVANLSDIVRSESASSKDVADAALALAYLQLKDQRRTWGLVLERAAELKTSFDAASLSALLWATTAAGVEHGRTLFDLSGPALKLLGSFSPAQVGVAAEAFGKAGVKDVELFDAISAKVAGAADSYKAGDLARVLYGLAAAGSQDAAAVGAISGKLAAGADQLTVAEAAQATWALGKLKRADKPALDAITKAAAGKLGKGEAAADVASMLWGLATLGYSPATTVATKSIASLKAGAGSLTAGQAITAAWSLGLLGIGDKELYNGLFTTAASALAAAPESLPLDQVALLYEASTLSPEAKLPAAAAKYSEYIYGLVQDQRKMLRAQPAKDFRANVVQAVAYATGARYRPEFEKATTAFPRAITPSITVDIAVDIGASKIVVEAVGGCEMTSAGTPLGTVAARGKVAEAAGYKQVPISATEFNAQPDLKGKATYVLQAMKKFAGADVSALLKQL